MAIKVECAKCHRELTVPGGILFGPPSKHYDGSLEYAPKFHLCVVCYDDVITAILANKNL